MKCVPLETHNRSIYISVRIVVLVLVKQIQYVCSFSSHASSCSRYDMFVPEVLLVSSFVKDKTRDAVVSPCGRSVGKGRRRSTL